MAGRAFATGLREWTVPLSVRVMRTIPDEELDHRLPARIAGLAYGGVIGLLFGFLLAALLGLSGVALFAFLVVFTSAASFVINRIVRGVPEAMASFIQRMIYPSGSTTPYAKVYSQEQSIAASGDTEGALAAYQDAMRNNPDDPEPRFQAAELAFRSKEPSRAVALYLEGRRLAGSDRARELFSTQRLIDLYLGPLNDEGKARVELRRLTDRFPGTREGEAALVVLKRLKELPEQ